MRSRLILLIRGVAQEAECDFTTIVGAQQVAMSDPSQSRPNQESRSQLPHSVDTTWRRLLLSSHCEAQMLKFAQQRLYLRNTEDSFAWSCQGTPPQNHRFETKQAGTLVPSSDTNARMHLSVPLPVV